MRFYQSDIQRWRRMDERYLGKCVITVNISQIVHLLHRYRQNPALPIIQLVSLKDVLGILQLPTNNTFRNK